MQSSRAAIYVIIVLAGLLGAISDVVLNEWARTSKTGWLLAAYACWIIVATVVGFALRSGYFGFGAAIVLFLLVNSAGALMLDRLLYGTRLSLLSWMGIALAFIAIVCIEMGRDHSAPTAP